MSFIVLQSYLLLWGLLITPVMFLIVWPVPVLAGVPATMTVFYQTLHVISGTWVSYSGEITSHLTLSTTMTIATLHHTG